MIQAPPSESTTRRPTRTGMRLIVPLQGVVQGRGGILLGSLIPCALFYFLQFYLKRNRSPPPPNPPSRSSSSANLSELPRSSSRPNLLSRGASLGRVQLSGRANHVAKPDESPYYIGLNRVREDAYDEVTNPDGVMQLGLAENRLSLDLIEERLSQNLTNLMSGAAGGGGALGLRGIATYQPMDGLLEFKMVRKRNRFSDIFCR